METLRYEIEISAPASTVWRVLTGAETYKIWVKAFSESSYAEGEWKQGNEMKFLDPDLGGTKAVLEIVEPDKRIVARHVALISKEGEISTSGEMADKWLGTIEDYKLSTSAANTVLGIEIKTHQDFIDMFNKAWPTALASIKELSEKNA